MNPEKLRFRLIFSSGCQKAMGQRSVHAQGIRHRRRATTDHDRLGESEEGAAQGVRGAPRVGGRPHERAGLEGVDGRKLRNFQNGMASKSSI